jgi:hypothetical protein
MNDEHHLFISHQAAADVLWDKARPVMLAAGDLSKEWTGWVRAAFLAGQATRALGDASRVMMGLRSLGVI